VGGVDEDREGVGDIEAVRHPEREDAAAEVVDDGVDVGLGAVEQPDHGGIDVPGFLGPRCPQADLGLARMNTLARSPPSP